MSSYLRIASVHRYVAFVTTVGLSLLVTVAARDIHLLAYASASFWVIAACLVVGELVRMPLPRGNQILSVSIGTTFTFALLITHGLIGALTAVTIASLIDDLVRRKTWWKALFNVAQFAIAVSAAGFVLTTLTEIPNGPNHFTLTDLPGMAAAAAIFFAVNNVLPGTGIALSQRIPVVPFLFRDATFNVVTELVLLVLAPLVVAAVDHSLALVPFFLVPMAAVWRGARVSLRNDELLGKLQSLYATTQARHRLAKTEDSLRGLLSQTCEMFDADVAMVTLFGSEPDKATVRTSCTSTGSFKAETVEVDAHKRVWRLLAANDRGILFRAATVDDPLVRRHLEALDVTEAMATPLRADGEMVGVVHVANRHEAARPFHDADLNLLETLASHISVSLENTRLVARLEDSLTHLREMNQLKDDFVASVSHELRTPLTSIKGYVSTLLHPDGRFDADERRAFLHTIERQSNRLHRLIEDLLVVSQLEAEDGALFTSWLSPETLVREVIDELRDRIKGHTLSVVIGDDLPSIKTDVGKVHQVLCNLVDNACKYSPRCTTITIDVRRQGNGVAISVIDQGHGVPHEWQTKIFDRFSRVDQSMTRTTGGVGLGLYISRKMVEKIGGRVWLERSDEDGSTFSLWLPCKLPETSTNQDQFPAAAGALPHPVSL